MITWDHGAIASLLVFLVAASCTVVFLLALHPRCKVGGLASALGRRKQLWALENRRAGG